jgi:GNAT superfamily N-acetyltransferase
MDDAASSAPGYPEHWAAEVVASDGGVVHLRPILPSDADAMVEFHSRLSERTGYLRYVGAYPQIPPRDLERFTVVDHHARVALVVLLGDEVIAVGRYEGTLGPDGTSVVGPAEATFVVRDDHQNRGLGSILLEHLAAAARERGVRRFAAEVLAENTQMVRVFRNAGFQVGGEFAEGDAASGVRHRPGAVDGGPRLPRLARRRRAGQHVVCGSRPGGPSGGRPGLPWPCPATSSSGGLTTRAGCTWFEQPAGERSRIHTAPNALIIGPTGDGYTTSRAARGRAMKSPSATPAARARPMARASVMVTRPSTTSWVASW